MKQNKFAGKSEQSGPKSTTGRITNKNKTQNKNEKQSNDVTQKEIYGPLTELVVRSLVLISWQKCNVNFFGASHEKPGIECIEAAVMVLAVRHRILITILCNCQRAA